MYKINGSNSPTLLAKQVYLGVAISLASITVYAQNSIPIGQDLDGSLYQNCDKGRCASDKNNLTAFKKLKDGTIYWNSKLALDVDGSWQACYGKAQATSQCPTSYTWSGQSGNARYIDPDQFAYIVAPGASFRQKTGINVGDIGMVRMNSTLVPVIVGDVGPADKIGEGSNALFKALGQDRCSTKNTKGNCTHYKDYSIGSGVEFFVFPGTVKSGLQRDAAQSYINSVAKQRYNQAMTSHQSVYSASITGISVMPAAGIVGKTMTFTTNLSNTQGVSRVELIFPDAGVVETMNQSGNSYSRSRTMQNIGTNRPYQIRVVFSNGQTKSQSGTFTVKPH